MLKFISYVNRFNLIVNERDFEKNTVSQFIYFTSEWKRLLSAPDNIVCGTWPYALSLFFSSHSGDMMYWMEETMAVLALQPLFCKCMFHRCHCLLLLSHPSTLIRSHSLHFSRLLSSLVFSRISPTIVSYSLYLFSFLLSLSHIISHSHVCLSVTRSHSLLITRKCEQFSIRRDSCRCKEKKRVLFSLQC